MAFTDRYGLTVTTASPAAFARFQAGMDRLLAYAPGAEYSFAAALAAAEALAVAHAGCVLREIHRIGGSHAHALRLVRRRLARRASPRDRAWLDRATAEAR
ncbi:MAG TPA: hypothetical protein VLK28_09570 [Methylomirabilota bacterium]|nr:hypothetical protein [Methylomirabilota bacterium]